MISGLEVLDGAGNSLPYKIHDTNIQKIDAAAMRGVVSATFFGTAQSGLRFRCWIFPFDVYIEAVSIQAQSGPPNGSDLRVQFVVNDLLDPTVFALPNGQETALASAPGAGILVPAGLKIEPQFTQVGSSAPGFCVGIDVQYRKRVVSIS